MKNLSRAGTASTGTVLSGYTFSSASGIDLSGTMGHYGNGNAFQWCGYENVSVQVHPEAWNQGWVTIPNTYGGIGYYDRTSNVRCNIANLYPGVIQAGVRVGRADGYGADDTNSIVGTFTSDAYGDASWILQGGVAYMYGARMEGIIPRIPYGYHVPTTYDYVAFEAARYSDGAQVIAGSGNLTAGNIRSGVNIFNVVGTLEEGIKMRTYGPINVSIAVGNTTVNSAGIPEVVRAGLYAIKSENCTYTNYNCNGMRHIYNASQVNLSHNSYAGLIYDIDLDLFTGSGTPGATYTATLTFYYLA